MRKPPSDGKRRKSKARQPKKSPSRWPSAAAPSREPARRKKKRSARSGATSPSKKASDSLASRGSAGTMLRARKLVTGDRSRGWKREMQRSGTEPAVAYALEYQQNTVFLVHGHDEHRLAEVARFLERLEIEVIALREMPNRGRSILEKFEDHADVGFALVLLTGDDLGGSKLEPPEHFRPRARQNVILELGYFLCRLGSRRVCALHVEGVEIPSDYSGVLFVPMDARGAWKMELARELHHAGIRFDSKRLF